MKVGTHVWDTIYIYIKQKLCAMNTLDTVKMKT